ncbi:hypothetical protein NLX86_30095 [Streptomyces sp. A3M-1-3]|uniref:hypothetical protein n=1 Tax=Streptomyces sp. A3M-1-3 TaxID=2962044 RepID=UPI0020B83A61|nr:hypothetical protein [Streptomyces sp. A3M-1-3]MCP3822189.1 hypothetical protein [Streptomyces sp. A3M-1-3]
MILRSGHWDELGQWHSGSTAGARQVWSDLVRTIAVALRRSTPAEVFETLTSNIADVDDLGRLAGWRLWRLINRRQDAHGYRPAPQVRVSALASAWDEADAEQLARLRAEADRRAGEPQPGTTAVAATERARRLAEQDAARAAAAAERAALYARWGIHVPEWREAEQVEAGPVEKRRAVDEGRAAALARAREERHGRRPEQRAVEQEQEVRDRRDRIAGRLQKYLGRGQE